MKNRINLTAPAVHRAADSVVLRMTPQQAQLLAASIWLGDADHTEWLDELADLLGTAAARGNAFAEGYAAGENARGATTGATVADPDLEDVGLTDQSLAPTPEPTVEGSGDRLPDLAAFADALSAAADAELAVAADLEAVAVGAADLARDAVAVAAERTRQAAQAAKATRAAATIRIAEIMAEKVKEAALALRRDVDEEAQRVNDAASRAAELVALAVLPGTEHANDALAASLAATISAAAVAKAEETALAAAVVARAAATAALEAAANAADAAMAVELEVADTAAAVQAVATATARQVAAETAHAAELILTTR